MPRLLLLLPLAAVVVVVVVALVAPEAGATRSGEQVGVTLQEYIRNADRRDALLEAGLDPERRNTLQREMDALWHVRNHQGLIAFLHEHAPYIPHLLADLGPWYHVPEESADLYPWWDPPPGWFHHGDLWQWVAHAEPDAMARLILDATEATPERRFFFLLPVLTAWHAAGETDKARQFAETERARVRTDEDRLEALVLALAAGDREAARALGEAVEDPGARGLVHAYFALFPEDPELALDRETYRRMLRQCAVHAAAQAEVLADAPIHDEDDPEAEPMPPDPADRADRVAAFQRTWTAVNAVRALDQMFAVTLATGGRWRAEDVFKALPGDAAGPCHERFRRQLRHTLTDADLADLESRLRHTWRCHLLERAELWRDLDLIRRALTD